MRKSAFCKKCGWHQPSEILTYVNNRYCVGYDGGGGDYRTDEIPVTAMCSVCGTVNDLSQVPRDLQLPAKYTHYNEFFELVPNSKGESSANQSA